MSAILSILSSLATWFGMDWRRIIYVVAAPLTVLALYLGAQAYVQAKMDAAVERARSEWMAEWTADQQAQQAQQRAAEQAANARADTALTRSQSAHKAQQKELNHAAQKGDDSHVGAGTNAVLDRLSNKPRQATNPR